MSIHVIDAEYFVVNAYCRLENKTDGETLFKSCFAVFRVFCTTVKLRKEMAKGALNKMDTKMVKKLHSLLGNWQII